jgi:hypothetical protein
MICLSRGPDSSVGSLKTFSVQPENWAIRVNGDQDVSLPPGSRGLFHAPISFTRASEAAPGARTAHQDENDNSTSIFKGACFCGCLGGGVSVLCFLEMPLLALVGFGGGCLLGGASGWCCGAAVDSAWEEGC